MAIPIDKSREVIRRLNGSRRATNLFAQARARQVLQDVGESPENFPPFSSDLEDGVTWSAYSLLAAACSLAEQEQRTEASDTFEQAASLLEQVHRPNVRESSYANFHVLIAAMAFYAAGQYSRAFVAAAKVATYTPAAKAIVAFIRKDVSALLSTISSIILSDEELPSEEQSTVERVAQVALARALGLILEFAYTGDSELAKAAEREIDDVISVATAGRAPSWWWIARLLRLMLRDLQSGSPWTVLPPYFPNDHSDSLTNYIRLLAFGRLPVIELWQSQRAAFPSVLARGSSGAVVNLRTSAGKTRVAEIAILQTLLANPGSKILYLAPFRSLAVEIEQTLSGTLGPLGFGVSHLYGGSRVSSIDTTLASEASIIIATPEKAKALLRSKPELASELKLFIIDEGHMIGPNTRFVRNEIFVEHLRMLCEQTGARLLLLSAVLPNAAELAGWIGDSADALAKSDWKPSAERFGFLRWNGERVKLEWVGDFESFNPHFVTAAKIATAKGRKRKFPNTKTEAVAATAARLTNTGPVMIFTAKAKDVPSMAKAAITALGPTESTHSWPSHEWSVFEAICEEELESDAIELVAARVGVICHSASLPPQVRWAIERLMRSAPPRIIVATSTLGQGVNVGISSVIVANPYQGEKNPIDKRTFWNICGRAGRAFVDGEGKILYAIDDTKKDSVRYNERLASAYFRGVASDRVESGILFLMGLLHSIARRTGVEFEYLLELVAENDFSHFGEHAFQVEGLCDLVDDELLAIHLDPSINPENREPAQWVDDLFRKSLAVIQSRQSGAGATEGDILAFLKARAVAALNQIVAPEDQRAVVSTGMPLRAAMQIRRDLDLFRDIADSYLTLGSNPFEKLVAAVGSIENWTRLHAKKLFDHVPDEETADRLRNAWLGGIGLRRLRELDGKAQKVCADFYGYELPWIIHAISQQLRAAEESVRAEALDEIALLVEIGVPIDVAARVFLAGIRSREAATEIAALGDGDTEFPKSIRALAERLRCDEFFEFMRKSATERTVRWLELLRVTRNDHRRTGRLLPAFALSMPVAHRVLHPRRFDGQVYLCSPDMRTKIAVTSTEEFPFGEIADNPAIILEYDGNSWSVVSRDPRLLLEDVQGLTDTSDFF